MTALGLGIGVSFTRSLFGLAAPSNVSVPVISGSPVVGQTLTASAGTWTGNPVPTYGYQWKRDGSNITSATSSTYTVVSADIGASITVTVTATNSEGSASATSVAVVGEAAPSTGNNLIWATGNPLVWASGNNLIWGSA